MDCNNCTGDNKNEKNCNFFKFFSLKVCMYLKIYIPLRPQFRKRITYMIDGMIAGASRKEDYGPAGKAFFERFT